MRINLLRQGAGGRCRTKIRTRMKTRTRAAGRLVVKGKHTFYRATHPLFPPLSYHQAMSPPTRRLTAYRVSALLFLLLGLGNIAVGRSRHAYYEGKKSEFASQVQDPSYKDVAYLRTLDGQAAFYRLVQHGGVLFLLVAGGILLVERVKAR